MIYAYLVLQGIALLSLFMWWHWWSGRTTTWLEGRKRGWRCFLFLTTFSLFQGLALTLAAIGPDTADPLVDSVVLRLAAVTLLFLGTPIGLLFTAVWAPQFVLPRWIRERRAAGDPVRTALPAPDVQHQMTEPQNAPPPVRTTEQEQLPTEFKVGVGRWWFGAIICGLCALVFAAAGLGADIADAGETGFGFENLMLLLMALGTAWFAVGVFARPALHPEHIHVTETGVETRNWSLAWEEISGVEVRGDPASHKGKVFLLVSPGAYQRVRRHGWGGDSARSTSPSHPEQPRLGLQPGTKDPPGQIADLVDSVLSARVAGRGGSERGSSPSRQ